MFYYFCLSLLLNFFMFFFFFNDTATTEIYTLSLHDALPIAVAGLSRLPDVARAALAGFFAGDRLQRSEGHTSELQSRLHLVCRLLLEKKKRNPLDLQISKKKTTQQKKHKEQ